MSRIVETKNIKYAKKPYYIICFYYPKSKRVLAHHTAHKVNRSLYSTTLVGQWKIKYKENA